MGRTHLAAIAGSTTVTVAGVAEPDPGARALLGDARVYDSLDGLLAAGGIDGALVAVPTSRHVDVLRTVLAAGLPALCEKPCGLSVEQARQCAGHAAAAGVVLQVAYWRRFVPELVALRRRMLGGELCELLAVNCYQWDAAPPPATFRNTSGGIIVDMGVHELDQVRWLTGQEFRTVRVARAGGGTAGGDPDCAQLVAELDGGATALVSLGRWHPAGDSCKVEVFGTKGTAAAWFLGPASGDAVFGAALRLQAEDFARAVTAGTPDGGVRNGGASVADAIAALRIAAAAGQDLGERES